MSTPIELDKAAIILNEVLEEMMVGFDNKEDRDDFILDIVNGFKKRIGTDDTLITAEWLCDIHPSLSIEQAGDLKKFCNDHTIWLKDCYDKEKMILKWLES